MKENVPALNHSRPRWNAVFTAVLAISCAHAAGATTQTASPDIPSHLGKRPSYVPPTAELLKRLSPAVVKVVVKLHGVPLATGSGFFVTHDGLVITSRRLVRNVLGSQPVEVEFITSDKKAVKDYKVASCDAIEGSELCSFKLNFEPRAFFPLVPGSGSEGDPVSVIGHPKGMDFSITRGSIVKSSQKTGPQQMDAPVAGGHLGAPAFDDQGRLLGMISHDNSIMSLRDLPAHLNSDKLPLSAADSRRFAHAELGKTMGKKSNEEFSPALGFAVRGKTVGEMKGFRDVALRFEDKILRVTLPSLFEPCNFQQKGLSYSHTCSAFDESAVFTIRRVSAKGNERLLEKNKKAIFEAKPVDAVADFMHADEWDTYESVLTETERKAFFSQPGPAQCQLTRVLNYKESAFSEAPACRFIVRNDNEPGALSVNVWLLKGPYLYELSMWVNNPWLAEYFANVPTLTVLTARWEKSLESPLQARALASSPETSKPVPVYRIDLPKTVGFMGTKMVEKKPQIDLYGKPLLLERFEEGFVLAVTNQVQQYLPPDFDDVTRRTAAEVARAIGTTLDKSTIETESMTAAGHPARLLTAFGKNKTTTAAAIVSAAVFFDDQTYILTLVSNAKDPGETYREFKALLGGFKLK